MPETLAELFAGAMSRWRDANPDSSDRDMAREARVDPAALSKVQHGRRGFSPGALQRVVDTLGLQPAEAVTMYEATGMPLPRCLVQCAERAGARVDGSGQIVGEEVAHG